MKSKNQPPEAKACSKQKLVTALREELEKERPDREIVLQKLNALEQQENRQNSAAKRHRRWRKTAIAAAVVLAFVFVTPPVFGAENIFDLIGRWTGDTFSFGETNDTEDLQQGYGFKTDHPGLQQVYDVVSAHGISERVVPTWLPEGYELTELKESSGLNGTDICAEFVKDNGTITFLLSPVNNEYCNKYAKDDESVVVYEVAGVKHYLIQNDGQWIAAWHVDSLACSIATYGNSDAIYDIIESIYGEAD